MDLFSRTTPTTSAYVFGHFSCKKKKKHGPFERSWQTQKYCCETGWKKLGACQPAVAYGIGNASKPTLSRRADAEMQHMPGYGKQRDSKMICCWWTDRNKRSVSRPVTHTDGGCCFKEKKKDILMLSSGQSVTLISRRVKGCRLECFWKKPSTGHDSWPGLAVDFTHYGMGVWSGYFSSNLCYEHSLCRTYCRHHDLKITKEG